MKRSQFNESQIAFILRQTEDGASVEEVCRKAGLSQQSYYRWRKQYGGFAVWNETKAVPSGYYPGAGLPLSIDLVFCHVIEVRP